MDRKSWIILIINFLLTCAFVIWITVSEAKLRAFYFIALWLINWVPGCIGLAGARLEGFKIPIFGEPSRILFFSFLIAWLLGIYINYKPNPYLDEGWFFLITILYPLMAFLFCGLISLGQAIFWWGYLYKKLERLHSLFALLITGILWGLWHIPLILIDNSYYSDHQLKGLAMMPLFTTVLSPVMFYLRRKGQSILSPAIFYSTLTISGCLFPHGCGYHYNDLLDGVTGINGIKILSFCSCIALILLWKNGAFKLKKI